MFKFVVLSAVIAVALAKPYGHGHIVKQFVTFEGPSSAVIHQSRTDHIIKPVVAGYSHPHHISKTIVDKVIPRVVTKLVPVVHHEPVHHEVIAHHAPVHHEVIAHHAPVHHEIIAAPVHHEIIAHQAPVHHEVIAHHEPVHHQVIAAPVHHEVVAQHTPVHQAVHHKVIAQHAPVHHEQPVSHQERRDFISNAVVTGVAAPLISKTVLSTPVHPHHAH